MWNTDLSSQQNMKICPVYTDSGEQCQFPFTYKSVQYNNCIILNNADNYPQCLTASSKWSNCLGSLLTLILISLLNKFKQVHNIVPTDAIVTQVTTTKAGGWWNNGASLNGGTMVFISGKSNFYI